MVGAFYVQLKHAVRNGALQERAEKTAASCVCNKTRGVLCQWFVSTFSDSFAKEAVHASFGTIEAHACTQKKAAQMHN
jgi:hypothetical protein